MSVHGYESIGLRSEKTPPLLTLRLRSDKYTIQTKEATKTKKASKIEEASMKAAERLDFQLEALTCLKGSDGKQLEIAQTKGLFGRFFKRPKRASSNNAKGTKSVFIQSGINRSSYEFDTDKLATQLGVASKELRKHFLVSTKMNFIVDPKYLTKLLEKKYKVAQQIQNIIEKVLKEVNKENADAILAAPLIRENVKKYKKQLEKKSLAKDFTQKELLTSLIRDLGIFSKLPKDVDDPKNGERRVTLLAAITELEKNFWWEKKPAKSHIH